MARLTRTLLLLAVMLSTRFSDIGFAQSDSAQISGVVRDSSGAFVPGALVTVKNESIDFERKVRTAESGYYVAPSLPPGYYVITVEAAGFKRLHQAHNKLDPNIPATVDLQLEIGAVSETVNVTASTSAVQTDTAMVGKLIESKQIQAMQLNGRNPIFLALLKPGVRGGSLAGFSFVPTGGGFNINGSRPQDVALSFDGSIANRTRGNGNSNGVVDVDTVQEVQVLTANYNAEYGRASGGQIRIVTRSGTNDLHGGFYDFFRNSALDANTWSRNRTLGRPDISGGPEAFRYNQFGYVLSGPFALPGSKYRNKLFWLWGQEYVRYRRAQTTILTVPSMAMRRGDFSELLDPNNSFFRRTRAILDPVTRAPLPNNVIPSNLLSRTGLALLSAYPQPVAGFSQGTNNFIQDRPAMTDTRKDTVSIDWNASSRQQVRFRLQNHAVTDITAFRGGTDRAPDYVLRPSRNGSLNYVATLSPTLVNEFLLTASNGRVLLNIDTRGDRYKRSAYGIDYPYLFPERKEIYDKIPTIDVANFATVDGGPYPSHSSGPVYTVSDNLSKSFGGHTIKAGFLFEKTTENDFDQINVAGVPGGSNNQNGRFVFTDTRSGAPASGVAVADAAMGLFTSYAEIGPRSYTPYRGSMYEWFLQDSWKATPKLRIEYGIRHTIIVPFHSAWGNLALFDPKFYDAAKAVVQDPRTGYIVSGDQYNGVVIPGNSWPSAAKGRIPIADSGEFNRLFHGLPEQYSAIHKKDFQPRLGLAYAINHKSVIRGGAGRFLTRPGVGDSVFLGGNPPVQPMVSISNGLADSPSGGRPSTYPLNVTSQDPVYPNSESWTWNGTFERQIPFDTTVEVAYIGRRGLHNTLERNINQLQPGTVQANPGVNPDVLRPYKGFGPIRLTNNDGSSMYNGLQIGVNRRFAHGLSYGLAYTLSKSTDNGSDYRTLFPNAYDARSLYGPSSFDTRHMMVINFIYELPIFSNRATLSGKLLGGWQVTGVTQFQTGTPITIQTGDDFAGVGIGGGPQIWNVNGQPVLPRGDQRFSKDTSDQNFYFRTKNPDGSSIFTAPATGTFTAQRNRNILYNPGFQNWNVGLFKSFFISERHMLQFRFEGYNWLNHPNWDGAAADPRSGSFGKVTSKSSSRVLQLSLKYSF